MKWSITSDPYFSRRNFSASAMPTPLAKPWPSGPVVTSTPGVTWTRSRSGWPGVSEPHWRHFFSSSSGRAQAGAVRGGAGRQRAPLAELLQLVQRQVVAREVQDAVEEHRAVAGAEDEAVAVGPL